MVQGARPLAGRAALITGGGQGVGQGVARAMAEAGADVVIAQRRLDEAEHEAEWLRESHGVRAFALQIDVTRAEQIERMVAETLERLGRLDVLVNNAGASFPKRLENQSDADMAASFDLNYWAVFRAMRAAFPVMKAQGYGRVINLGSLNGVNAHMFTAGYNASKEAVRALTRTAAVEWGPHGITCNVICPSATSPQARDYFEANPAKADEILSQVPAGRFGHAVQDIGPVAVFLASEGGGYMTGNTLFVDGGGHINGVAWRPEVGA
ncbi:NAD(P)-dependent dehydrogenase (short-subunit alcohol dehydrogenase family) [Novosphingobium sp. PhB165]|uniref:SDR family NAD(P)-dependent oxidoreductase n=1 Tax=Novosphingobium sp. PhB165 TaxID=2485105 RepID=UPI00104D5C83|nr:SDR family oxidoreductase [Novosphingobium sp. PhB165]TCM14685.1 NAD(P)-dependent dehydrogenase (short-subunit alcohol dehydrogenase family) [Novosphingobium sp. PhB165]